MLHNILIYIRLRDTQRQGCFIIAVGSWHKTQWKKLKPELFLPLNNSMLSWPISLDTFTVRCCKPTSHALARPFPRLFNTCICSHTGRSAVSPLDSTKCQTKSGLVKRIQCKSQSLCKNFLIYCDEIERHFFI